MYGDFIPAPAHNIWQSHTATLNEAGWKDLATDLPATALQMQTVLSNLSELNIHGEFGNGPDTSGLDNVKLSVVPAPGSLITALIGVVPGVLMLRRCRK